MYRILIVDDEAKIREVLAEYAEFEGFASDQAADGMEAVNKCKNEDYDLILMDIMMPKLDGYSAGNQKVQRHSRNHAFRKGRGIR